MRVLKIFVLAAVLIVGAACSQLGGVSDIVPTTGDTASDASAAQRFVPDFPGYTTVDAVSITDALTKIGTGASVLTANPASAALVAQIDGMIQCYRQVGAVAAKVYVNTNITQVTNEGRVPAMGALAVVNQDRVIDNFLPCALGSGRGLGAQTENLTLQPCSNSGTFTVNNETLLYVYAATQPELCNLMQGAVTVGR